MRYFLFTLILCLSFPAIAQDAEVVTQNDLERRLELSKELHVIKPIKPRIDNSINTIAKQLKAGDQRTFAATVKRIINYKTIETTSINAMAEVYTTEELAAMVEYYSKPEAVSAAEKQAAYQDKVGPEITKMLDRALMEMRTGR